MAKEARRQKQLAKKKAKRNEKRTQMARATSADPTQRLMHCNRWPITYSAISDTLWEDGIGHAVLARRMPDGMIAHGTFLLDVWCLGVKDSFWAVKTPVDFRQLCEHMNENLGLREVSPEYVAKLVTEAVAYADKYGFHPHGGFRHASRLLDGIDPAKCEETFEFGKDGAPLYVSGPNDTPERARDISLRVHAQGGHYMAIADMSDSDFAAEEDEDDADEPTGYLDDFGDEDDLDD
jgi:hypothetical protein